MNETMQNILLITQIVVSILLVVSVLLQNRAEGLGSMFGGGGEVYRTKRGLEKLLYYVTIILITIIVIISFILVKYSV